MIPLQIKDSDSSRAVDTNPASEMTATPFYGWLVAHLSRGVTYTNTRTALADYLDMKWCYADISREDACCYRGIMDTFVTKEVLKRVCDSTL